MRKFSAAMGKMRAGVRNCKVAFLSDSTGVGAGATGAVGYGAGGRALNMPVALSKELNRIGIPSICHAIMGTGMLGTSAAAYATFDTRVTFGAGWALAAVGELNVGNRCFANTTTTNPFTFTPDSVGAPNANVDSFEISAIQTASGGIFSWSIDGGAATQVNTSGTDGIQKTVIGPLTPGAHTLTIARVSGNVWITAIRAWDTTQKQVEILNMSMDSAGAAEFLQGTTGWGVKNNLAGYSADLAILQIQIGEPVLGIAPTSFATDLQTIVGLMQTNGDVWMCSGYPSDITYNANTSLANQNVYRTVIAQNAATNNLLFEDIFTRFGSKEIMQAVPGGGMYTDLLHLNAPGYAMRARWLAEIFRQY